MDGRIFLKHLSALILSVLIVDEVYGADILIHDGGIDKGVIYSVSPDGTNLKRIGDGLFPQWSPDRKFISYVKTLSESMSLVVVNSEGREVFNVSEPIDKGIIMYHTWDPKGEGIAFIRYGPESSVVYYDIKSKKMKTLHTVKFKSAQEALLSTTLEWSPDGEKLLFSPGYMNRLRDVDLIDLRKGTVKKLIDAGLFPRFISKEKVLFVINSEIWSINIDGSDKRKLHNTGVPILSVTKEAGKTMIFLTKPKDLPGEPLLRLFLLNLENNKLGEIKTQGYAFVAPEISPDGSKFAAIGSKLRGGELEEEDEYCVYDLRTKETTFLKKVEASKHGDFGVYILLGGKPIIWH
jgi:Tol biopolymer transport system component